MEHEAILMKLFGLSSIVRKMAMAGRRFRRVIEEHGGVLGGLIHIARQLCPVQVNLVFTMDTPVATEAIPQITIMRYSYLPDVGSETLQALTESRGTELIREFERLFDIDGQLWIGLCGDEVGGVCWSRSGLSRSDYFVPLSTDDANILSCFVFPQFRGRGIYPTMLRYIASTLGDHNGIRRVFIDCKSWNYSSIRGIEKAGFHLIGRAACIVLFGRVVFHYPRYILL